MYRQQLQPLFRLANFPVSDYGDDHFTVTPEIIGTLRMLPYVEQWRRALDERWYHVRLEDHSLLVFDGTAGRSSFSYLQCPLEIETMREFLSRMGLDFNQRSIRESQEEYERVWETSAFRQHLTPIRFDQDPPGYEKGRHPLAHIHIGLDNNVRIAMRRVMSPRAFALFVMRQMYPESWKRLVGYSQQCNLTHLCRHGLALVEAEYWQREDEIEAYLA